MRLFALYVTHYSNDIYIYIGYFYTMANVNKRMRAYGILLDLHAIIKQKDTSGNANCNANNSRYTAFYMR